MMTFAEAYQKMLTGHKVRRHGFKGYWFIDQETGIFKIKLPNGQEIPYGKLGLAVQNCAHNDWEIVEEE